MTQKLIGGNQFRFGVVLAASIILTACGSDSSSVSASSATSSKSDPTKVENCDVPVNNLCVLGGPSHQNGLVEKLLESDGPLGPISKAIDIQALSGTLAFTLENDGRLANLLENLLINGQLEAGLQLLILGDENGEGGLQQILTELIIGSEDGRGLVALFGEDGLPALLQALLADGTTTDCQAPLGNICLYSGDGTQQEGLLELLLAADGELSAVSPILTQHTDELLVVLGDLLESNGSLSDLVQSLLQEGQLAEGLQALLFGDPDNGVPGGGGLFQALGNIVRDLVPILEEVLGFVGGFLGSSGDQS